MSNALNFGGFFVSYCNLKEKDHLIYMWNQYCYFDLQKIWVSWAHTTKNSVAFPLNVILRNPDKLMKIKWNQQFW